MWHSGDVTGPKGRYFPVAKGYKNALVAQSFMS